MGWRESLKEDADEMRSSWKANIKRRRNMTPDQVEASGDDWALHEVTVTNDYVVEERLKLALPREDTCPYCFWISGTASIMKPIPHPENKPDVDSFKCDLCGRYVELPG